MTDLANAIIFWTCIAVVAGVVGIAACDALAERTRDEQEIATLRAELARVTKERDEARDDIQKMRAGLPLSYSKATTCEHAGSWTTYDGKTCMACELAQLEKEYTAEQNAHGSQRERARIAEAERDAIIEAGGTFEQKLMDYQMRYLKAEAEVQRLQGELEQSRRGSTGQRLSPAAAKVPR